MMYSTYFSTLKVGFAVWLISFFCFGPPLAAQSHSGEFDQSFSPTELSLTVTSGVTKAVGPSNQSLIGPVKVTNHTLIKSSSLPNINDVRKTKVDDNDDKGSKDDDDDDKGGKKGGKDDDDDDKGGKKGDKDDDDDDKGGKDDDDDNGGDNCQCEGKMQNFTVTYNGVSGATIYAYDDKMDNLISTYTNVQDGDQITVNGFDDKGRLKAKTKLVIGNNSYEVHTSCSQNILGETYGPFNVISFTDGEGSFCDGSSTDDTLGQNDDDDNGSGDDDDDDGTSPDNCQCEGKMQNFTVTYNGVSGATIYAYDDKMDNLISTYTNVQDGDQITVNGFDDKGRLKAKTKLVIGNNSYEVHTSCSQNILGFSYGPFNVISYTDGEGSFCDGSSTNDDDDDGGDDDDDGGSDDDDGTTPDCQCEGKMQNFTVIYNGTSGVTITGHKKKGDLFKTYNNVQNGDVLSFDGFDSKGRLESKTFLKIDGVSQTEIHTSCSIQILGQTYGAFSVISYTDGEGSSCSVGPCAFDTTPPTVLTQNVTLNLDANGNATITTTQVDNGSSDDCNISLSLDKLTFTCTDIGENTVTLTGTDPSGNSASATAIVTIVDVTAPVFSTQDVTVNLDENGEASVQAEQLISSNIEPQPEIEQCSVEAYNQSQHAVWLSQYTPSNSNVKFRFDANGGTLLQSPDGTASLSGTIVNPNNPNDSWAVQLNLAEKKTWEDWADLGRTWKGNPSNVGDKYKDWSYYIMSPSLPSTLTGLGSNAGKVKTLAHKPSDYSMGFQVGEAANDKNTNLGMSGWFTYENDKGNMVQGDFNLNITSCETTGGNAPCGDETPTVDITDFTCSDIGVNTITVTVTDQSGNSSTQTANVTVVDNIAPTIITQNVSIELDANGNASITVPQVDNGSYDNCDINLNLDKLNFTCEDIGVNTVTLTGTDSSGNTASGTATVTVVDNIAPTVIAQNITVELDENGTASITANQVDNGSFDNCDITLTVDQPDFSCGNLGENVVTLTGVDPSGNMATATATVTVVDNIAPEVVTQNITVSLDENGMATIQTKDMLVVCDGTDIPDDNSGGSSGTSVPGIGEAYQVAPIIELANCTSDNCGITEVRSSKTKFNCNDLGENIITITVTDGSGNSTVTTAIVTVVDDTAPDFETKNVTVNLDENGEASIQPSDVMASSFVEECSVQAYNPNQHAVVLRKYDGNANVKFLFDQNGGTITQFDDGTALITATIVNKNDPNDSWAIQLYLAERKTWDEWSALGRGWKGNAGNVGEKYKDWNYYIVDPVKSSTLTGLGSNTGSSSALSHKPNSYNFGFQVGNAANNRNKKLGVHGQFGYKNLLGQNKWAEFNLEITDCNTVTGEGPCGDETVSIDKTDFTCADTGTNTVSVTVTDQSGNTTVKTATVTVVDNIAPTVVAQDITVELDENGNASITANQVDNGSFDNCDITLTVDQPDFSCGNIGENVVTLTGVDPSGNMTTATAIVTVVDNIAPEIVTKNITVELKNNGKVTIKTKDMLVVCDGTEIPNDSNGGSGTSVPGVGESYQIAPIYEVANCTSDNCGITKVSSSKRKFNCNDLGENVVTITVTDASGNSSTATAIVTVVDNIAPTIVTQNVTVALDANGNASITPGQVDGGSSDNCDVSLNLDKLDFSCENVGSNIVTLTGVDASGNTASGTATVTVVDNIAPTVITQNITVELDENGTASITASQIDDGSSDNCNIDLTVDLTDFSCGNIGENTVTLTGVDPSGNMATATATVTVVDNIAPEVVTQNITVSLDENGMATIQTKDMLVVCDGTDIPDDSSGGSSGTSVPGIGEAYQVAPVIEVANCTSDNCGITEVKSSKTKFTCNDLGENIITITVTDGSGNSTVTTAVVTVVDDTAPDFETQNVTVNLDGNGNASIQASDVMTSFVETSTVKAYNQNQHAALLNKYTTANEQAKFLFDEDNASFVQYSDGTATLTGVMVNKLDPNDSWSVEVNLADRKSWTEWSAQNGDWKGSPTKVFENYQDWDYYIVDPSNPSTLTGLGSNAGITSPLTHKPNNKKFGFQVGKAANRKNKLLGITGGFGYKNSQGKTVRGDFYLKITASNATTGNGPCGDENISIDKTDFTCADEGTNTVTVTVTDQSGNTTVKTATVTVVDNITPTVIAQNITVELDENGTASITASQIDDGSFDNCNIDLTVDLTDFSCGNIGENTVTLTGVDPSGNIATATATVTVVDNIAPEVVTQNITVSLDENGMATIQTKDMLVVCDGTDIPDDSSGGGSGTSVPGIGEAYQVVPVLELANCTSDNCGITEVKSSKTKFTCNDLGENIITITVTDGSGNSTVTTAVVTVVDDTAPEFETQNVTVNLDGNGNASIQASDVMTSFVETSTVKAYNQNQHAALLNKYTTANEAAKFLFDENNASFVQHSDGTASLTGVMVNKEDPNDAWSVEVNLADRKTWTEWSAQNGDWKGSPTKVFENYQDWDYYIVDPSNPSTLTGLGSNAGITSPLTHKPNNKKFGFQVGKAANRKNKLLGITGGFGYKNSQGKTVRGDFYLKITNTNTVTGNGPCGDETVAIDKTDFTCADEGTNTVTITVTDQSGNTTVKTATVTVVDNITPTVIAQNITVELDENGTASITASQIDDGSFDNCNIDLTVDLTDFSCGNIGENTVTLTGVDPSGNIATATATVTVVDNIAPEVVTQNITVSLDENGMATIQTKDMLVVCDGTDIPDDSSGGGSGTSVPGIGEAYQVAPVIEVANCTSDNCGITKVQSSKTEFNCNDLGENIITITVTDGSGNSTVTTAIVTVVDDVAPEFETKNVTVNLDENGEASIQPTDVMATYIEECTLEAYNPNVHAVVLRKYDGNANVKFLFDQNGATLTQFGDGTATITATIVKKNDPNDAWSIQLNLAERRTWQEWSDLGREWKGIPGNVGENYKDWDYYVVDPSNPSTMTGQGSNAGKTSPLVHKPNNKKFGFQVGNAANNKNGDFGVFGLFGYENLEGNVKQGEFNLEITNCNLIAAEGPCGDETISIDQTNFTCADTGVNTVSVTVTDQSGNATVKTATVTVVDNISPTVITQNITVELDANGNTSITAGQVDNGSYDNCDIALTVDQTDFSCGNIGENIVTLTGVDPSGNMATGTAIVTVVDNIAPEVVTQNITVELDVNGEATIETRDMLVVCDDTEIPDDNDNGGSSGTSVPGAGQEYEITSAIYEVTNCTRDNCGITKVNSSKREFDCGDLGENVVTITVTDASGNSTTATAIVTVVDNIAPTIITQNVTVELDANGNASITVPEVDNGSFDNCDVELSLDKLNFTCEDLGVNTVTLTGVDPSGNSASGTATVTLLDVIAPTLIVQDISVQLDANGNATITASQVDNGSNDNCGISGLTITKTSFDCSNLGENIVTVTATDLSGNSVSASATITIIDDIAPVIGGMPSDIVYQEVDEDCGQIITWSSPVATDNCNVTLTSTHNSGDFFPVGTTTVTYTATDGVGNQTSESFDVEIIPTPIVVTLEAEDASCNDAADGTIDATISGGCAPYTFSWSGGQTTQDISALTAGDYTLTVTDANGTSQSVLVTVNQPDPLGVSVAMSPKKPGGVYGDVNTIYLGVGEQYALLEANAFGGTSEYTYSWSPGAEVLCADNNVVTVAPQVTTTYSVLVTDQNGCTTTKEFTVEVVDVRCENTPDDPLPVPDGGDCQCEGRMQNFTVVYNGISGVTVKAYDKKQTEIIATYTNVQNGDEITVSGTDSDGRLESKTNLVIGNAAYEVHTSCSEDILGFSYGPFTVISYTDGEGVYCDGTGTQTGGDHDHGDDDDDHYEGCKHDDGKKGGKDDDDDDKGKKGGKDDDDDDKGGKKGGKDDDDDDKGGKKGGKKGSKDDDDDDKGGKKGGKYDDDDDKGGKDDDDDDNGDVGCECEGKMQNFIVIYRGTSGATVKAYTKKGELFKTYTNVSNGDYLIFEGFDRHDRLESKTKIQVNDGPWLEVHTSCSEQIIGNIYGDLQVTSYTDGEGNYCESEPGEIEVCDTVIPEWHGKISICFEGEALCVSKSALNGYLAQGAKLGSCDPSANNDVILIPLISNTALELEESTKVPEPEKSNEPTVELLSYPNPTASQTTIKFSVDNPGKVVIDVYNTNGIKVAELFNEEVEAKTNYSVVFDASRSASGIYLIRMQTAGLIRNEKLIVRK